jgi:hypothetical protein
MPERGKNGWPTWVTQRVWGELKAYVDQPAHPALCSGAVEALDFYAGRLAGFRTHMRAVAGLHAKARELVRARVAAAVATVNSPETSGSSSPVPPVDAAVISYPQLIIEAAAVLVPVEQLATIAAETQPSIC